MTANQSCLYPICSITSLECNASVYYWTLTTQKMIWKMGIHFVDSEEFREQCFHWQ